MNMKITSFLKEFFKPNTQNAEGTTKSCKLAGTRKITFSPASRLIKKITQLSAKAIKNVKSQWSKLSNSQKNVDGRGSNPPASEEKMNTLIRELTASLSQRTLDTNALKTIQKSTFVESQPQPQESAKIEESLTKEVESTVLSGTSEIVSQGHPSTQGTLTRDQAEKLLHDKPAGTWLLRYSVNNNGMVATQKTTMGFDHRAVDGMTTRELTALYGEENQLSAAITQDHPFNCGTMGKEQAERILKRHPEADWILRYSENQKKMVLSFREGDRIKHGIVEGMTISNLEMHLEGKKRYQPKYDHQVHLNLGSGNTAKGLEKKAYSDAIPTKTVDLRKDESTSPLQNVTHNSRVYLIGHGGPGNDYLSSDEGKILKLDDFVSQLKSQAPHLEKPDDGQRIKISLVACHGGSDRVNEDSFAVKLSKALDRAGIPAEVIGRTDSVDRADPGKVHDLAASFHKQVMGRRKVAGDKVAVVTKEGQTTVKPLGTKTPSPDQVVKRNHPYSHGAINSLQANEKLESAPAGTWLIRYSSNQGMMVVSKKTAEGIVHDNVTNMTLGELLHQYDARMRLASEKE